MDQTVMIRHLEDHDIEQAKNLLREYVENPIEGTVFYGKEIVNEDQAISG